MPLQDKLNIAVFVDYDNIEIGLKSTLRREFDVSLCLDALKERGDIVAKFAYANWGRQEGAARQMAENAVQMVQRLPSPRGDKNGGDINLALDALEMAFTHTHVNAFAIISGDSDFIPLVNKLKEYGKTVYVVGGKAFTSTILQANCHEFIAYENLLLDQAARMDGGENGPHMERLKQELQDVMSRGDGGRNERWSDRRDANRGGDRGGFRSADRAADRVADSGDDRSGDRGGDRTGDRTGDRRESWAERRNRRREERDRRREERMGGGRLPLAAGGEGGADSAANNEPRVTMEASAALPLVERSLQTLERRGVQAQLGLLKSTMMQLDPTFHERGFGCSSFSDFIDRLRASDLIEVQGTGGKLIIERKGGPNAKPLPEPDEALPLLRDALEAHRYEMEMGDGVESSELHQWLLEEHPQFDAKNFGFLGFREFLNFAQDRGVSRLQMDEERGMVVYLGREFFPPPAPPEPTEEEFYSEFDEVQPYVEGQPSMFEPNPPPPKPKKATRARKAPAKKASSATKAAGSRTRKRKTD
ncbi:MAG: hypothetical protein OHK0021_20210 [Bryobacter sp.]